MIDEAKGGERRTWVYLGVIFIALYVAVGLIMTAAGKGGVAAWLGILPLLAGPVIGVGIVRLRRRRNSL